MNLKVELNGLDSIKSLDNDELTKLSEICTNEQKEALVILIKELNDKLMETIKSNEIKVMDEVNTNIILLKRVWRGLDKEQKKECAVFFSELEKKLRMVNNKAYNF